MKNRLVFDDRKLHYPSKRIFITGYERNERVYRFINSSIGSIEVWKTLTDSESIYIHGNMYNYNFNVNDLIKNCSMSINTKNEKIISINPKYKKLLLSNDKTIVNIAMDCILDDAKDFIDEYLKKFK